VVCQIEGRGRYLLAREVFPARSPEGGRLRPLSFAVRRGAASDLAAGDLAAFRLEGRGATLVRRIGRVDRLGDLLAALLAARGVTASFSEEVEREAARQGRKAGGREGRRDLTSLPTCTIDPADAKDHDDAISARREGEGVRVWVHIADVSAYVPAGGAVDREALERATSTYLPGTVVPMLPERLSNDLCSLKEGKERLAVSVELVVGKRGVREASFYRSVIRSDARLTYEQVDSVLGGRAVVPAGLGETVAAAHLAARWLAAERRRRGALELESFEPEVRVRGEKVRVSLRRSGGPGEAVDARGLIEQLMVAANEAVAARVAGASAPALYRVHPRPDPRRVEQLRDQLYSLDLPTVPLPERMAPHEAAKALSALAHTAYRHLASLERREDRPGLRLVVASLILRSVQQAFYSPEYRGHAALASTAYCHFTSPIRRYPDLVVHRALLAALGEGRAASARGLDELGRWTSEREREAVDLEREADGIARAFALLQAVRSNGELGPLAGEVVGLSPGAAYVAFRLGRERLPPFEGVLPLRALRGRGKGHGRGRPELNDLQTAVCDPRGRTLLRLGMAVEVWVSAVEPERGRVLLSLAPPGRYR